MTSTVLVPHTGELLALDATTDDLAAAIAQIRDHEAQTAEARRQLEDELLRRLDHENRRSADVGGWHLQADPPNRTDWDTEQLAIALAGLELAGVISPAAAEAALPRKVERRPDKRELTKLLNLLDDEHAQALREAQRPSARRRRLTVKAGPEAAE